LITKEEKEESTHPTIFFFENASFDVSYRLPLPNPKKNIA